LTFCKKNNKIKSIIFGGLYIEFLFFWITSSVLCLSLEVINELRIFKDTADAGYILKFSNFKNLDSINNPYDTKILFLSLLTPIYYLFKVFERTREYNNVRNRILDELYIYDLIEEMTEYEKEEYNKKPTTMNALVMNILKYAKKPQIDTIVIDDSTIYYETIVKNEVTLEIDYKIIKVTGPLSIMNRDKLKIKINDELNRKMAKELFGSDEIIDILEREINNMKEDEEITSERLLEIEEELRKLKEYKSSLTEDIKVEEKSIYIKKEK